MTPTYQPPPEWVTGTQALAEQVGIEWDATPEADADEFTVAA